MVDSAETRLSAKPEAFGNMKRSLKGDGVDNVITSQNDASLQSAIDGFTITNGDYGVFTINSTVTISNNEFSGNSSGGIRLQTGSPIACGNVIRGGTCGVVCENSAAKVYNNVITASTAIGVNCFISDASIICNNTIVKNDYGILIDNSSPDVRNNIVAFNTGAGIVAQNGAAPSVGYNCVYANAPGKDYEGVNPGTGSISPTANSLMFVDKDGDNYHLVSGSPCVDAGSDAAVQDNVDLERRPRKVGTVDMGAYELAKGNVPPGVICVDRRNGSDSRDGSAWSCPMATIEAALAVAAAGTIKKEVWVAEGTYVAPANYPINVGPGLSMYGGFDGSELWREQRDPATHVTKLRTVIGGGPCMLYVHGTSEQAAAIVDGFDIYEEWTTDQPVLVCDYATFSHNVVHDSYGDIAGAVVCAGAAKIVNNLLCCNSGSNAGAIFCEGENPTTGSPIIVNNTIVHNTDYFTAAIYFDGESPTIANNIIAYNTGGICKSGGSPSLFNNNFFGNGMDFQGFLEGEKGIYYTYSPEFVLDSGCPSCNYNYKLQSSSLCIDRGVDSVLTSFGIPEVARDTDLGGTGRISGTVDLGAYEYNTDVTAPSLSTVRAEDNLSATCTLSKHHLYATWTTWDYWSTIMENEYAIGTSSSYDPNSLIVPWTSVGRNHEVVRDDLDLQVGQTYYFYVRLTDFSHNTCTPMASNGVTVGCTSGTIENALRCPDHEVIVSPISNLVVTGGTQQFNAPGQYHAYVMDNTSVSRRYGLRIEFEGVIGNLPQCGPGDKVSIKGRMDTIGGERVMIIDLADPSQYTFAVTGTWPPPSPINPTVVDMLALLGYSDMNLYGVTCPGITRPYDSGGMFNYNKGELIELTNRANAPCFVTYVDDAKKFFYVDDRSFDDPIWMFDGGFTTDGNGLNPDGTCARGTRVDWSWITGPIPTHTVGTALRITGLSSSMELNGEIIRVIRLRSGDDIVPGPEIFAPVLGSILGTDQPIFEWVGPSHSYYQLSVSTTNYPDTFSSIIGSTANQSDSPVTLSPGVDYYAFVRVGESDNVDDLSWSAWSRQGYTFKYDPLADRLILPENASTANDDQPLLLWKYDRTVDSDKTFSVKICRTDDTIRWSADNISEDHIRCGVHLEAGNTFRAYVKRSDDGGWGQAHEFTVAQAADVRCVTTGSVSYQYDDYGNTTSMTDSTGTTAYTYDGLNRLIKVDYPGGRTVRYQINRGGGVYTSGYNVAGQRIRMIVQSTQPSFEHTTKYDYDGRWQLAQVIDQLGGVTAYSYNDNGTVQQITYPNQTRAKYTYNNRNWLLTLRNLMPDDTTAIANFTYDYGGANYDYPGKSGVRTSVSETVRKPDNTYMTGTVAYTYDEFYRLTQEVRTGNVPYSKSYAYDLAGNRTSMTVDGITTSYGHDAANKMTSAGTAQFAYDGAGNMIRKTDGGVTTSYTWDWRNKLVRFQQGAIDETYTYDGRGNRVGKNATQFVFDGSEIAEEIDGSNVMSYVGPGLISDINGANRRTYHADGIGSTRAISTVDNGNVVVAEAAVYDAYGNAVYSASGVSSFGYAGGYRYYADSSGLNYLKARYYDPVLGRFISMDPISYRGGLNLYAYASSNPCRNVDPTGLCDCNSRCNKYEDSGMFKGPGNCIVGSCVGAAPGAIAGGIIGNVPGAIIGGIGGLLGGIWGGFIGDDRDGQNARDELRNACYEFCKLRGSRGFDHNDFQHWLRDFYNTWPPVTKPPVPPVHGGPDRWPIIGMPQA